MLKVKVSMVVKVYNMLCKFYLKDFSVILPLLDIVKTTWKYRWLLRVILVYLDGVESNK